MYAVDSKAAIDKNVPYFEQMNKLLNKIQN